MTFLQKCRGERLIKPIAALRESLLTLGYRHSYHMVDAVASSPYRDCKLWIDLLNKKEAGEKVTREDLDGILGHCQVSKVGAASAWWALY